MSYSITKIFALYYPQSYFSPLFPPQPLRSIILNAVVVVIVGRGSCGDIGMISDWQSAGPGSNPSRSNTVTNFDFLPKHTLTLTLQWAHT